MDDIIFRDEEDFADLARDYDKYLRSDSFYDQMNRGSKVFFITMILLAFSVMHILSAFVGLI